MQLLDSPRRLAPEAFTKQTAPDFRNSEAAPSAPVARRPILLRALHSVTSSYTRKSPSGLIWERSRVGTFADSARNVRSTPLGGRSKRCLDFTIALSALIVMAPLMLILALLILVTMGRPVVFVQQRVGFGRASFGCFKFRSMVPDAQERLTRYLAGNSEAARMWRETQKLPHDPRVTWLGHLLRKSSLDELPQLFNILRGDMSCVGPRPVLSSELDRYGPYAEDYAKAKPGLTGIWQVSGRSTTTYMHRVNCDRYYVRRWSLGLDVMIILRTIPAVMRFGDTA